jgi:S-DNA-T family DNA segregation ATPase FtsK/SpoIIIE
MTFSLQTLLSPGGRNVSLQDAQTPRRFTQELVLLVSAAALLLTAVALLTYSHLDPAWSTSGERQEVHNWLGLLGATFADGAYFFLGASAWWLWLALAVTWGLRFWRWWQQPEALNPPKSAGQSRQRAPEPQVVSVWSQRLMWWLAMALLLLSSCVLEWSHLHRWDAWLPDQSGGLLGERFGRFFTLWLGSVGLVLVSTTVMLLAAARVCRFSWLSLAERIGAWLVTRVQRWRAQREQAQDKRIGEALAKAREEPAVETELSPTAPVAKPSAPAVTIEAPLIAVPQSDRVAKESQQALFDDGTHSALPQVSLLDKVPQQQETVSPESLELTSRLIEKKLGDFGVEVRVVAAAPGPVITRYEIEPATGVKGSQIVNLARDLARSLSLVSIRVIETIPGKNYMALELPNARRQTIRLSEILGSSVYNDAKSLLTVTLGKDIVGKPVVADLAKMPHCLVAGTTGSGKSVGINAMILSLLYKADPQDVRLLMIDPKMLEMSVYEGIPHLLAPVVTDMKQAAHGLNWCVAEMEKRYKLMSKMGVRNVSSYNQKIKDATARGELIPNPFSLTPEEPEPLQPFPFIVVVIDELADLMMVVGKKIEELIARLAQKARAAGIHLILATQRPSVDVITGLIKANIPTRVSFQVSSKIDSRTILDQMGAEALLGMGDMLFLPAGTGFPQRVHGAFVSDDEVHRVVEYLKTQGEPNYIEGVLEGGSVDGAGGALVGDEGGEKDPMYDQAVEVVLKHRKASISLVQRHLKIGYNRAARMLEEMETAGLVSSMSGSGQREILVPARDE